MNIHVEENRQNMAGLLVCLGSVDFAQHEMCKVFFFSYENNL